MKAISYETKIKSVRLFVQMKPLGPVIIQNMSYVNKKNVKYDKESKNILMLLRKTPDEASKVITNSLIFPFLYTCPLPWRQLCHI